MWWKLPIGVAILLVIAPMVLTALLGRTFLYYPSAVRLPALKALASRPGWDLAELTAHDGQTLRGLVRPASDPKAPWLVFFGGNASAIDTNQTILEIISRRQSWGLVTFSYRGYDASSGSPHQAGIVRDAQTIVDWLRDSRGVAESSVVLLGQSLGSGVAAHVAHVLEARGAPPSTLVLLSPYTSISQVFDDVLRVIPVGWAMKDSYRTDKLTDNLAGPVLIVHGDEDTLIGFEHAQALANALGDRAKLERLSGVGHDIWNDPRAFELIRNHIANLQQ